MKKTVIMLCLVALLGCCLSACEKSNEKAPLDKVTLQLKWFHQAQFAGFYVAKEKGYYQDENLDVTFLEGGKGVDGINTLVSGRADFAVVSPEDVIIKKSQGAPIEALAAIYQRSAVVFMTRADSGIIRPFDFDGKVVAVGGKAGAIRDFQLQFNALMKKLKIDGTSIKITPYDPDYTDFKKGTVDVTPAYITGGFIKMKKEGYPLNVIWPGDYGIHCYSDTLATRKTLIDKNPELIVRFLRATLKGWRKTVGDTETAVSATMKYARVKNKALQTAMMEAQLPLVHTGEHPIGWMQKNYWQEMIKLLHEQGVIPKSFSFDEEVFTVQFLNRIYKGAKQ
jgi:NitT/TauT family transport system substrate-binding protein